MPTTVPVITHSSGDVFPAADWNSYLRDNINKLLDRGHRVLTVAQFTALSSPEGTKGSVAPDEVYVEVDATNGVQWHVAYESGEATYKWRFIGGPPMFSEVTTAETTTSATYAALATAGPSIALPRSGDYDVAIDSTATSSPSSSSAHSYDIGGTGAADADAIGIAFGWQSARRDRRKTGLTPVTLTSKYKVAPSSTLTVSQRRMAVTPVRIRHDA